MRSPGLPLWDPAVPVGSLLSGHPLLPPAPGGPACAPAVLRRGPRTPVLTGGPGDKWGNQGNVTAGPKETEMGAGYREWPAGLREQSPGRVRSHAGGRMFWTGGAEVCGAGAWG